MVEVADHNGVSEGDEDGTEVIEDAGKEDMFVDCPDELVTGGDGKEAVAVAELEDSSEEKLHLHEANGREDDYAVDELERLRAVLDKTVREKESVSIEYKVRLSNFI